MDAQDTQDFSEITKTVIGCSMDVINELGSGFLESVYEKALLIALEQKGLTSKSQFPIPVQFRNQNVGNFIADILVENKVLVELKATKEIAPEHEAQIINYLKATGYSVGLLINFVNPKLQFKRYTRSK